MAATLPVRQPTIYVAHGGGPMPLLGEARHKGLTAFLRSTSKLLPAKPSAILCVTAHWEERVPTVSTNPAPPMLYDYGGFPPESYQIQYPAPGSPELAQRVVQLLQAAGLPCNEDAKRGFDHGTFVPLKLAFPDADVPVVQLSVMSSMDPEEHLKVGKALAPLRDENVLIFGSGSSFHNMRSFMSAMSGAPVPKDVSDSAQAFDDHLQQACTAVSPSERERLLKAWEAAPGARLAHPREEHLIPLHVVAGAAGDDAGKLVHNDHGLFFPLSSFLFGAQGMQPAAA